MSTTLASAAAAPAASPATARSQQMLHGPLVSTLLRLAAPNIVGLFAMTLTIAYDGFILGRLGADALAGAALVLPLSMLMLQMSAGGFGGASTAAVARALGAGNRDGATRLAQHALFVALVAGALFTLAHFTLGRTVYSAMGGDAAALGQAIAYANVIFGGAVLVWLGNVAGAIVRGTGNMVLPAATLLGAAVLHMLLCPLLVFGWGSWNGFGIAGASASTLVVNTLALSAMLATLLRRDAVVHLARVRWHLKTQLLRDILRVGIPASLSPVISNGSIAASTALVATYGTAALAGYGLAARLEYLLVPIAFGFGGALTAMVATNMGAGRPERAIRVTWIGSGIVAAITGVIGVTVAIAPALWMNLFSGDAEVRRIGSLYLNIAGGSYALFGFGLALFFASQGAGRMAWALAASMTRLITVAVGGWVCVHYLHAPASGMFAVIGFSLAAYGLLLAAAIKLGAWGTRT
ncbi:MAG TPA: MATE family efflux transporter [Ramlibacter sp.]|nr:MATE family efflux transporter [Ramlibacter sp.]